MSDTFELMTTSFTASSRTVHGNAIEPQVPRFNTPGTLSASDQGQQPIMPFRLTLRLPQAIPGLHAGEIWTSADFDDPLPEELFFGDE